MKVSDELPPCSEVYALKYAEVDGLAPDRIEIGSDPHQGPHAMAYYIWLVRQRENVIVVDTGFNALSGEKRGRRLLHTPEELLRRFDVDPHSVRTVIVTHLHYDHFGNSGTFPNATFHVQDKELAFTTGRFMRHDFFREMYEVEDVIDAVRNLYAGRVVFHDGDGEIAPGVTVHLASGHTPGVQFVRVWTRSGWLVLASDSCHYTFLRQKDQVYPVVFDPGGLIENYARLRAFASTEKLIIPGHDPIVMEDFPEATPDLKGIAVRLD